MVVIIRTERRVPLDFGNGGLRDTSHGAEQGCHDIEVSGGPVVRRVTAMPAEGAVRRLMSRSIGGRRKPATQLPRKEAKAPWNLRRLMPSIQASPQKAKLFTIRKSRSA
jgi:hypothetical protein